MTKRLRPLFALFAAAAFILSLPGAWAQSHGARIQTIDLPQLNEIAAISVVLNDDHVFDARYGAALEAILEAYDSTDGCFVAGDMPAEQVFAIRAAVSRFLALHDDQGRYSYTQLGIPQEDGTIAVVHPELPPRLAAHVAHFRENHMDTLEGLTAENFHPIMLQRMGEFMGRSFRRLRRAGAIH